MAKTRAHPGTWIEREMFESKAFLSLTGFAPQLLILVLSRRQFRNDGGRGKKSRRVCTNCDSINITYREYKNSYGIPQPRLTRAIEKLLKYGFISIVHAGGGCNHDKSIYALSTKWQMWQPGMTLETRKKDRATRGFCKPRKK